MIRKLDYIIKNLDFKKKIYFSLFVILFLMIIGYATASTSLFATGGTEITQDYENFKVIIDKVVYDGYINEINNDNVSFSFTTNLSDDLTESDVYVELFNDSEQYDVNATLLCDAVSDSTYSITLDKSQFRLNAKTKDVVNIKLNKLGEFTNKTINCQFTIEGIEKNELANDYTEDAPSSNEIFVERSSDSDNKTLKEELDELRRMAKNRGNSYTISFNSNGGNSIKDKQIIKGENIGELPSATKGTNYFEGWYLEDTYTTKVDSSYIPDDNKTLYARFGTEVDLNLAGRTMGYPSNTAFDIKTKRSYTMNTYVVGLAFDNYYKPSSVSNYSLNSNSIYVKQSSGYGIGLPMQLTTGKYIVVGNITTTAPNAIISIIKYTSDGTSSYSNKSYTNGTQAIFSFTIGSSDSYEALVVTGGGEQTEITVSNIHLYKLD